MNIVRNEGKNIDELSIIFCDDNYLHTINKQYLNHDTLTDIITFPYKEGEIISGDIFISIDRVKENAATYHQDYSNELLRVMAHGVLHLLGYGDKTMEEAGIIRLKEKEAIELYEKIKS